LFQKSEKKKKTGGVHVWGSTTGQGAVRFKGGEGPELGIHFKGLGGGRVFKKEKKPTVHWPGRGHQEKAQQRALILGGGGPVNRPTCSGGNGFSFRGAKKILPFPTAELGAFFPPRMGSPQFQVFCPVIRLEGGKGGKKRACRGGGVGGGGGRGARCGGFNGGGGPKGGFFFQNPEPRVCGGASGGGPRFTGLSARRAQRRFFNPPPPAGSPKRGLKPRAGRDGFSRCFEGVWRDPRGGARDRAPTPARLGKGKKKPPQKPRWAGCWPALLEFMGQRVHGSGVKPGNSKEKKKKPGARWGRKNPGGNQKQPVYQGGEFLCVAGLVHGGGGGGITPPGGPKKWGGGRGGGGRGATGGKGLLFGPIRANCYPRRMLWARKKPWRAVLSGAGGVFGGGGGKMVRPEGSLSGRYHGRKQGFWLWRGRLGGRGPLATVGAFFAGGRLPPGRGPRKKGGRRSEGTKAGGVAETPLPKAPGRLFHPELILLWPWPDATGTALR